jgi:hypothetical protein
MTQSIGRCIYLFVTTLALMLLPGVLRAQNICGNAAAGLLCLDQPHETETQVTGKVTQNAAGAPTPGAVVMITVNGAAALPATVNADGTFVLKGLPPLNHFNTVRADQTAPAPDGGVPAPSTGAVPVIASANANSDASVGSSLYTLGLAGINVTGSSTSGPSQQYFAEFNLIAPLPWLPLACSSNSNDDILSRRCWVWLNPRIASVPTTSSTALSSFNSSSLITGIGSQSIGGITQSFEFQAGGEFYIAKPSKTWGLEPSWAKTGISMIFGGGALTPFNSITSAPEFGLNTNLAQQFSQNTALATQYPQLAGALCSGYGFTGSTTFTCPTAPSTKPTTVAFVFPNRSRFYRSFYGGFRLRFFYFTGKCTGANDCQVANIYPGSFDVRFGEDESVTAGHLVPLVMTLTGTFPVPGTKGVVRVFGSSYTRLQRNVNTPALVLVPSTSFLSLDNAQVAVQPIQRSDLDYFRLGVGVDLVALIGKFTSAASK